MADHSGWRNFWWLNVALHAVIFIAIVFGFPETKWHRLHPKEMIKQQQEQQQQHSSDEKVNVETHEQDPEKLATTPTAGTIGGLADLSAEATAARDPYLGRGKPSKAQFRVFQPNKHPFKSILMDLWIPWKLFAFPIVEFSSFAVSFTASSFLTINLTQSQNFAAPPYNFSSERIGFFNIAILIGAMIGLATNGLLSDWISDRATKRNRGIREPEMRLPTMIPYVIIMLIGNFVVAFGYQNKWNWQVSTFSFSDPTTILISPFPDHRSHRFHVRRHPGRCSPCHHFHLQCRLLQARGWQHLCCHHRQQERLGLWFQQIHYPVDHQRWLRAADHVEHVTHCVLLSAGDSVLFLRKDIQEVD
jgi:hypothetical protein